MADEPIKFKLMPTVPASDYMAVLYERAVRAGGKKSWSCIDFIHDDTLNVMLGEEVVKSIKKAIEEGETGVVVEVTAKVVA